MGRNYSKGMYNQLMEVMVKLDVLERTVCKKGRKSSLKTSEKIQK